MEVILTREVQGLGKAGQKLAVKDGYARNFLLPRGWAVAATRGSRSTAEALAAARLRSAAAEKEKALEMAERLSRCVCDLALAAGEQGKLHGAVTAADITNALAGLGITLEKHQVELEKPLTQLGEHAVDVKLHPEVRASLKVLIRKR